MKRAFVATLLLAVCVSPLCAEQDLAQAVAADFEASLAELEDFFRRRGREMVAANRVQAMFPVGSRPIPNSNGTAAGIEAELDGSRIYIEMRTMFADHIAPHLPAAGRVLAERVLHTFGTGESDVAARITDLMDRDANPMVGTTVAAGLISIRITARGASEARPSRRPRAAPAGSSGGGSPTWPARASTTSAASSATPTTSNATRSA